MYMAKDIQDLKLDNEFKVKFNGELHEIDANTLINTLLHLNSIIQETNREIAPEKKIDVKIKALDKGSFLVHIELVQTILEEASKLFTTENIANASGILTVVAGLYQLKKFLAGRKPKEEAKVSTSITLVNTEGNKLTVTNYIYNIYSTNQLINEALTKSFQTLENDESITEFAITDVKEKPIVSISREDFAAMAEPNQLTDKNTDTILDNDATLSIVKMSFDSKLKSEFYYRGFKITAKITDAGFYKSVDSGRRFAKGDALKVILKIVRHFDPAVNHFLNKGYEVVKVVQHIPRPEQLNL
jgi:hypothetical protein